MTPEEILAKHVFGEDQEMRSLFYMDLFSADLVETNDTIYDAVREYASRQSDADKKRIAELEVGLQDLVMYCMGEKGIEALGSAKHLLLTIKIQS